MSPKRKHHFVPRPRTAPPEIRRTDLPPAWQELLDVCFRLWFGSIHDLAVHRGEPAFTATTVVVRTVKLAWQDDPQPPAESADYAVRSQVLSLIEHAARLGDGVIERIEVVAGLPKSIQLRGPAAGVLGV